MHLTLGQKYMAMRQRSWLTSKRNSRRPLRKTFFRVALLCAVKQFIKGK